MSDPVAALAEIVPGAWLVGGTVRDRALGRETADFDVVTAGSVGRRRPGARPGRGRFRLRAVRGVRRLADRRPRPHLAGRRAAAQRGDDRGGPEPPRPDHQRHRRAPGRRRLRRPLRRPGRPQRAPAARRLAGGLRARPAADAAPGPAGLRAGLPGRARRPRSWPGSPRPGLAGVAPERVFAELRRVVCAPGVLAGLELDGRDRRHRRGPARAGGAAGGRAEPLSPPRRGRSHPFGAGGGRSRSTRDPERLAGERRAGARALPRRAAGQRPDQGPGPALRRPAARHRQAPDARGDAAGAGHLHGPRRGRGQARPPRSWAACAPPSGCASTSPR